MKGSYVALITPFRHERLDEEAFCRLVTWHQSQGTEGVVVGGCTGEGMLLSAVELGRLTYLAVQAQTSLKVWVGIGALSTTEALERAYQAQLQGAHGLMLCVPPSLKLSQEQLITYVKTLHDVTSLPLMFYNNPGRTGVNLEDDTLIKLGQLPRVVALKDSIPDPTRSTALKPYMPDDFSFLWGEDLTIAAFLAQGGHGWVSVTANLFPRQCADLCKAWHEGDMKTFAHLRDFLYPLSQLLLQENNPTPVKQVMASLGWCLPEWRDPLSEVSEGLKRLLDMKIKGLLEEQEVKYA